LVAHQGTFRTIKVFTHIDDELWLAEGDSNQFQQVMLNLLLNASDAVAEDGSVAVLVDRMTWQDGTLVAYAYPPELDIFSETPHFSLAEATIPWDGPLPFVEHQPVLRVVVADNGAGIAAEHLAKVFDPFFTTKEAGEGTGLGLAICTRIIESYGGVISVRSQEEKGTAFIVLLPGKGY
jgi:signal transduction histidine kinase